MLRNVTKTTYFGCGNVVISLIGIRTSRIFLHCYQIDTKFNINFLEHDEKGQLSDS